MFSRRSAKNPFAICLTAKIFRTCGGEDTRAAELLRFGIAAPNQFVGGALRET